MKKIKRRSIYIGTLVVVICTILYCLFSKKRLYKQLGFELPKDTEIIEMEAEISVPSLFGMDNEILAVKFMILDESLDDFLETLAETEKIKFRQQDNISVSDVAHQENIIDS